MVEPGATAFNLMANVALLHHTLNRPLDPVPRLVVACQVSGNLLWVTHSTLARDWYLFTTSLASLLMQVASLFLLSRPREQAKPSRSETELPCLPPVPKG